MHRREILAASLSCAGWLLSSACARHKHVNAHNRPPAPRAPATSFPTSETGLASWYGHPYHGRRAADGEIYDMEKLTAAHRTLPFNTWVRVTNLTNNKVVTVRIIDRGPFVAGRIIDLSHAAARKIELIGPGVAKVRMDVIAFPEAPPANLYSIQVGSFKDRRRAERLRETLEAEYGAARLVLRDGQPPMWRLLVGVESSPEAADQLARKLQAEVGSGFVVRLDERPPSALTASGGR